MNGQLFDLIPWYLEIVRHLQNFFIVVRGEVLIEDTNVSLPNKWLGIWINLWNMKVATYAQLPEKCIVLSRNPIFSSQFIFFS